MINNIIIGIHYHILRLSIQACLLISWHGYVQYCQKVYAYLTHDDLQVDKKFTQMTLDISMLNNNFPLYIKTRIYHLNYPNVLC